jgi:hypothetical protein
MAAVVVRMLKEEIPQPTGWHPDESAPNLRVPCLLLRSQPQRLTIVRSSAASSWSQLRVLLSGESVNETNSRTPLDIDHIGGPTVREACQ